MTRLCGIGRRHTILEEGTQFFRREGMGREVELASNILASQCTALRKRGGWLSVLRIALRDWEKV